MKKCFAVFTVVLFLMVLFVPCSSAQQKFDLKMMTGPMGGSWYPLGGAIADAIQKEIPGRHHCGFPRRRGGKCGSYRIREM